jgi:uncharacterized protein YbaR (Trm112 family)
MDPRWLEWVVCPRCRGRLDFREEPGELWCPTDRLIFPIREGIPVLLLDEAQSPDESSTPAAPPDPSP